MVLGAARADANQQADIGRAAIVSAGCVGCHNIPGSGGAAANVGPSLAHVGARVYIAGVLPNTRANMIRWITHTQEVRPGDAMPSTDLSPERVNAIAAYLETLR